MSRDDELLPIVQAERDDLRLALLSAYRLLLERSQLESQQKSAWDALVRTVSKTISRMHDEGARANGGPWQDPQLPD